MGRFSATDAAFSGFRLVRERPGAVLWWALLSVALQLLGLAVILAIGGWPSVQWAMGSHGSATPAELQAMLHVLGPAYLILAPILVLYSGVVAAAVVRTLLASRAVAFGGLELGKTELRVIGALLLLMLVFIGLILGVMLLAVLISLAAAKASWVRALVLLLGVAVVIFVSVRLSLAVVATVAEDRIGLGRSWVLTRGRFWPLLGAYVLTSVFALILALLAFVVSLALTAAGNPGAGFIAIAQAAMRWPEAGWTPLGWGVWAVVRLLWIVLAALLHAVWAGPVVAAYKAFSGAAAAPAL